MISYHYVEKGSEALLGHKPYDDALWRSFLNGTCRHRNDRLKFWARCHEGPWWFIIPSRPTILGKQIPIHYYRACDFKLYENGVTNSRSKRYEPFDFQLLNYVGKRRVREREISQTQTNEFTTEEKGVEDTILISSDDDDDENEKEKEKEKEKGKERGKGEEKEGTGKDEKAKKKDSLASSSSQESKKSENNEENKENENENDNKIGSGGSGLEDFDLNLDDLDLELDGIEESDENMEVGNEELGEKSEEDEELVEVTNPCACGKCTWIDTKGEFPEYIEIELQPDGHALHDKLITVAHGISKRIQVDMIWALEGQNLTELPERVLAAIRFCNFDLSNVTVLD